jgi:hypothetical protein
MTHQMHILVRLFLVRINVTVQIPNKDFANDFPFLLISPRGHQYSIQPVSKAYHQKSSASPFDKWYIKPKDMTSWQYITLRV